MRKVLPILLLILIPRIGAGQQPSDCPTEKRSCVKTEDLLLDSEGCPVRLTSAEMMSRATAKSPINRPGLLGRNNINGSVEVEVVSDKRGKVRCARVLSGHPLAHAAAVQSVTRWSFKPYTVVGKRKAVAGVLNIPFDFRQ